jgi:hypothetical protein
LNAKEFEFDVMTNYSYKNGDNTNNIIVFTNSKDNTYYLKLLNVIDSWEARLYDYKELKIHYFNVIEEKTKVGFINRYVYKNTTPISSTEIREFKDYTFEFKTIEESENSKIMILNIFKNVKKKKPLRSFQLELIPNSVNSFNGCKVSCIHPYELIEKLYLDEECLVKNIKDLTYKTHDYNLVDHQIINLKLTSP